MSAQIEQENEERILVDLEPENAYKRILKVFVFQFLLFNAPILILQVLQDKSFEDMFKLYMCLIATAFAFTAFSWFRCKVVVYYFSIRNDTAEIRWKKRLEYRSISVPLANVHAKLVEAGRYESALRLRIVTDEKTIFLFQCGISGWYTKVMLQFINDLRDAKGDPKKWNKLEA